MKLEPLFDKVVVKRLESEEVSKGGIIIPEKAKVPKLQARVIAVGKGRILDDGTHRKMTLKVGDLVLFAKYAANDVEVDNDKVIFLDEEDCMARIKEGGK